MSVNNEEKINYIKNVFHPYFDIELDSYITSDTPVNLVIPLDSLEDVSLYSNDKYYHNIPFSKYEGKRNAEILSAYSTSPIQKNATCTLYRVIDGDTLELKFTTEQYAQTGLEPYVSKQGKTVYPTTIQDEVDYVIDRFRLVGINTPEIGDAGGETSKKFLEKICSKETAPTGSTAEYLNGTLSVKVDSLKKRDMYGRALAVLFIDYDVQHKNINEVLLKEGLAEVMVIGSSEFTPSQWAGPNTQTSTYHETSDSICRMWKYLNDDLSNLVFTPDNDLDTIYSYEIYKNILFLRIFPYSSKIRMHILPKGYDCMNNILFFKDEFLDGPTESSDYENYSEISPISCRFQTSEGDRDRTNPDLSSGTYDFNKFNKRKFFKTISNGVYTEEDYKSSFCEFEHDISKSTRGLTNLQINAGYHYNSSTPYYSVHYTGVKDTTNIGEAARTLVDANYDKIETEMPSNNIVSYKETTPETLDDVVNDSSMDINHLNLEKTYHKTIKYMNDSLYVEEEGKYISSNWSSE